MRTMPPKIPLPRKCSGDLDSVIRDRATNIQVENGTTADGQRPGHADRQDEPSPTRNGVSEGKGRKRQTNRNTSSPHNFPVKIQLTWTRVPINSHVVKGIHPTAKSNPIFARASVLTIVPFSMSGEKRVLKKPRIVTEPRNPIAILAVPSNLRPGFPRFAIDDPTHWEEMHPKPDHANYGTLWKLNPSMRTN